MSIFLFVSTTLPSLDNLENILGHQEPLQAQLKSNLGHLEHNLGHLEPNQGYLGPNPGHLEPNLGHLEPNLGHLKPKLGHQVFLRIFTTFPSTLLAYPHQNHLASSQKEK